MSQSNLIGKTFGRLTVINKSDKRSKNGTCYWTCQCECGNIKDILTTSLTRGTTKSCGCYRRELVSNNFIGQRFGKVLVLEDLNKTTQDARKLYKCQCDCGNIIELDSHYLTQSTMPSCGCHDLEVRQQKGANSKKDLTNQKFGKLTAIKPTDKRGPKGEVVWLCKCDCGKNTEVISSALISKKILSCGCLNQSHGELLIQEILKDNNINFESEYIEKNCQLSTGGYARFDFKVNNYFIEFDGVQHFYATNRGWNTEEHLKETQLRDSEKNEYCLKNNIPLIRIPYTHLKELCLEDLLLETSKYVYQEVPQE